MFKIMFEFSNMVLEKLEKSIESELICLYEELKSSGKES